MYVFMCMHVGKLCPRILETPSPGGECRARVFSRFMCRHYLQWARLEEKYDAVRARRDFVGPRWSNTASAVYGMCVGDKRYIHTYIRISRAHTYKHACIHHQRAPRAEAVALRRVMLRCACTTGHTGSAPG